MDEKKKKWEKPELIDIYSITLETTGAPTCTSGPYATSLCNPGTQATGAGCNTGTSAAGGGCYVGDSAIGFNGCHDGNTARTGVCNVGDGVTG